jgi:hypothetical protein
LSPFEELAISILFLLNEVVDEMLHVNLPSNAVIRMIDKIFLERIANSWLFICLRFDDNFEARHLRSFLFSFIQIVRLLSGIHIQQLLVEDEAHVVSLEIESLIQISSISVCDPLFFVDCKYTKILCFCYVTVHIRDGFYLFLEDYVNECLPPFLNFVNQEKSHGGRSLKCSIDHFKDLSDSWAPIAKATAMPLNAQKLHIQGQCSKLLPRLSVPLR